jgi:hypothetical protein
MFLFAFDRGLGQAEFEQELDTSVHSFDLLSLNFHGFLLNALNNV